MYPLLSNHESLPSFLLRHIRSNTLSFNILISELLAVMPVKSDLITRQLLMIQARVENSEGYYATVVEKRMTEGQREALMGLFKERNRALLEVAVLQGQARAQRNQIGQQEAYSNFSYTREMDFNEERRRVNMRA